MSELQSILNKFKKIDETLSSIPSFADFTMSNNKKHFKTKLAEINSQQEMGLSSVSKSKSEKIMQKWELYTNSDNQNSTTFNLKEMEFLASQAKVIINDSFWELLMETSTTTHKMIIGLARQCFVAKILHTHSETCIYGCAQNPGINQCLCDIFRTGVTKYK